MLQDFQIVDINDTNIPKVCVQFKYKNYIISASKIMLVDIIAFDQDNNPVFYGNSIEDVIDQINNS